ncbi:class I tRNA ligase family protein [Spirillospora sp. NBC_00431]
MGKSLKNGVSPDEIYERYGADTLRLYEMAMGPLDIDRPWRTEPDAGTLHRLHQTIAVVRRHFDELRFNTAIARLMELTTHAAKLAAERGALPRALAEPLVLMVAPLAPHVSEELWNRLGHRESLLHAAFPEPDPEHAADRAVAIPVQINGKTRFTVDVPAGADRDETERILTGAPGHARYTGGMEIQRVIIVPGRIINIVARPA